MSILVSPRFWFTVLESTTPVLFATLAACIASKSGILNLAIEGIMLSCALFGVIISAATQNLLLSTIACLLFGILMTWLLTFFIINMRAPAVLGGVAFNLLGTGGTVVILVLVAGNKSNSTALSSLSFPNLDLPLVKDIPFVGGILSGHNLITYMGWILTLLLFFLLFKTKLGSYIRSVGENEPAAQSLGIPTLKIKYVAMMFSGICSAFGGMYMSMGALKTFTAGMVAGRGYLALAMDAMCNSHPIGGFFSSLLYGFSDTITVYMQLYTGLDTKAIDAFPYIFIIIVMVVFTGFKNKIRHIKPEL